METGPKNIKCKKKVSKNEANKKFTWKVSVLSWESLESDLVSRRGAGWGGSRATGPLDAAGVFSGGDVATPFALGESRGRLNFGER